MKILKRPWSRAAAVAAVLAIVISVRAYATPSKAVSAGASVTSARAGGLGQVTGLLPRDHLMLESVIQVDLTNETARLPLYPGTAYGKPVWYVLLDASDAGLAHDLGVNCAPKLANIAVSCPAAAQTVTLGSSTPQQNPLGPDGFPLAKFAPGAVAGPRYIPFIKIAGPGRGLPCAEGLNSRQIDQNVVFNLAATRLDLLTGVTRPPASPSRTARSGPMSTAR